MSAKIDATEADKLQTFRNLLQIVEENTKKEFGGGAGNRGKESRLVKDVVAYILGRKPTEGDLAGIIG